MDKKSKKNLIIRLIVYPIVIVIVFLLCGVIWIQYAKDHPEQAMKAHVLWLKLKGIEYCETPEEAIQLYAEALIKGDRDEALEYVDKPKYEPGGWEGDKRRLYSRTNEELKEEGERILNGHIKEEDNIYSAEWVVIYNINGEIVAGDIRIVDIGYDGWKIE